MSDLDLPNDGRRLGADRTCHIPVVILSADAISNQLTKLLAAGAVAYLTKPLEIPKFLQTLDDTLDPTGPITLAAG